MIILLAVGVVLLVKRSNKTNEQLQQNFPDTQIKQTQDSIARNSHFNDHQPRTAKSPQAQSLCDTTMTQNLAYTAHTFHSDDHPAGTICEYEVPLPTSTVSWFCSNTQPRSREDSVRDAEITSNPAYGVVHLQKHTPAYRDKEDAILN